MAVDTQRFARAVALLSAAIGAAVCAGPLPAPAAPSADATRAFASLLHWRSIGPFRGGRTVAVSGVPGRPNEFYIGAVDGGVFKTTDAGRTWLPIFDDQPSASIGAIAVAPSAPDTVYAGSGESRQRPDLSIGDGIYKSTDAGAHWTHLGLRDGQQIGKIAVDPNDANRLFVAVLGHPYGPNGERGVYRSTDGGATFARVLFTDENAGAFDVTIDPSDARTLYASLWSARQPPWETSGGESFARTPSGSGLYKSADGGATWNRLEGGLPAQTDGLGRISVAVARSMPKRVYAVAAATRGGGVYRSDDAGATWHIVNATPRVVQRGADLATIAADPHNADVVYVTNTSTYRSNDAGATFVPLRGAPGGDDYQGIWIDPDRPSTILLGSDQGAVISLNGGATWSSWYNQPTAQFYHVITDDRFPYRVYGGQQESGSAGVLSRGNDGTITFRDWHPVGVEEYGYVAPDPLHPGIIYGGKVTRFDEHTGEVREVGPVASWRSDPVYRFRRTAPLAFSPVDKRTLYLGANVVLASRDYGVHWTTISPDLTRRDPATPANLGVFAATDAAKRPHRGVVYALGLSPRDPHVLWAGTDDGLVWHTADGGTHWKNVTPRGLDAWAKISIIDASPFDAASAYVAVNRFRLDEQRPQLFRTSDGGATWTEVDAGIEAAPTNVVRADPRRRGLLYAGTERGVWVSFDDGRSWASLRLNLPATSVRDLVVHGDDVVIATHGRGFWILDDATPLRQIEAVGSAQLQLLAPAPAWRVRRDVNTDAPLPPDEPAAANPPAGAVLDYVVPAATRVELTVADAGGHVIRRFASDQPPHPVDADALDVPAWWIAPPRTLAGGAGAHRFVWDLRAEPPRGTSPSLPIAAVPHDTPPRPEGPFVPPGTYRVTLSAGSAVVTRALEVRADPRRAARHRDLVAQFAFASQIARETDAAYAAWDRSRGGDAQLTRSLSRLNAELGALLSAVDAADAAPTAVQRAAFRAQSRSLAELMRGGGARRDSGERSGHER